MDTTVNYYRIEKAIAYLTDNYKAQPDLDELAAHINVSPIHFQKIFLDWVGITPKKFLQYITIEHLKNQIRKTRNVTEAAGIAGLSSQSRVYDLFVNIEGVSPQQFKSGGSGLEIFYGYHASPFGMCFIAVSERGISDLHFVNDSGSRTEFTSFTKKWPFATLIHKPEFTQTFVYRIFKEVPEQDRLNLLVQGTEFQIKVWQALVDIPFGCVKSYNQVAREIGNPTSVRSVASAAGRNPISFLIPCHRIIAESGTVGDFQWGKVRKRSMIGWEMARVLVRI